MAKNYNFGEKEVEKVKNKDGQWEEFEVWQTPKFKKAREKAIELIEKDYGLSEADYWILMNRAGDKMAYTGLIISHNGCLKINDKLENKVNPKCFSIDKEGYANSLVFTYIDDDTYEVGEFSQANCKNGYPYAMAFKRCFDRVVLKKSKLAYDGIYSEVEADEYKENQEKQATETTEELNKHMDLMKQLDKLITNNKLDYDEVVALFKVEDINQMTNKQLEYAIDNFDKMEKKLRGE